MDKADTKIDRLFEKADKRIVLLFEKADVKVGKVVADVKTKFDKAFVKVDDKLSKIDGKFESADLKVDEKLSRFDEKFDRIGSKIDNCVYFMVGAFAVKGGFDFWASHKGSDGYSGDDKDYTFGDVMAARYLC